jgi:hypothetical protein
MKRITFTLLIVVLTAGMGQAKVDLVTLPTRDTVQLTIYNSADMTLVRESRALTLKDGENKLQFSWENTLIDPTSLEMLPKANADKIDIADLTYPPRVQNLGLWNIDSGVSGKVPVEISYLTSGLSWRAFYMGTLTENEETMRLQGYVRVTNNSGEDYENAQTRLIVGKVHILDEIAELARRQYPYGRPGEGIAPPMEPAPRARGMMREKSTFALTEELALRIPKEIIKEGLSEYFLYTIEGKETIPTGWSKRLLSFDVDKVPVVNLYKYEEERYGTSVVRFLSFKNDEEHELGETPIPGGMLKVYRDAGDEGHLSYTGQSSFKYIPVDEDVELNLGAVADIVARAKLMDFKTDNYEFDRRGDVSGWDEIRTYQIEVKNTRDISVKVEIKRNFNTSYWQLDRSGDFGEFEQVDIDTIKFTLELRPKMVKKFEYVLTTYHGTREDNRTKPISGSYEAGLPQKPSQKTQIAQTDNQPLIVRIIDKSLPCGIGRVQKNRSWNEPYRYVFHSYPEYIENCQHILMKQQGGGATGRWFKTGQIGVSKQCWLYAAVYNSSNQQRQIWQDEGWDILPEILQDLGDFRRKPRPVRDYILMRKHISEGPVSFDTKAEKTNMVIWIFKEIETTQ